MYIYVCVCTYIQTCMSLHAYILMYVMYVCMYVCMCVCVPAVQIHAYIHTNTGWLKYCTLFYISGFVIHCLTCWPIFIDWPTNVLHNDFPIIFLYLM